MAACPLSGGFAMSKVAPLVDLGNCPDIFASGIAKVERIGGDCVRLTMYVNDTDESGKPIRVVVAKLVRPIALLVAGHVLLGTAFARRNPERDVVH